MVADDQLIGDFLVVIALGDQEQHRSFSWTQGSQNLGSFMVAFAIETVGRDLEGPPNQLGVGRGEISGNHRSDAGDQMLLELHLGQIPARTMSHGLTEQ